MEAVIWSFLGENEITTIVYDYWADLWANDLKKLKLSLSTLESSIYSHSGDSFNIDSPKQLGEVLFGKLVLDEKAK